MNLPVWHLFPLVSFVPTDYQIKFFVKCNTDFSLMDRKHQRDFPLSFSHFRPQKVTNPISASAGEKIKDEGRQSRLLFIQSLITNKSQFCCPRITLFSQFRLFWTFLSILTGFCNNDLWQNLCGSKINNY